MADFRKLPDGSLVMRGQPPPAPPPSLWQRLRGAIGLMPVQAQEPSPVPWWMNLPPQAESAPAAPAQPATPVPTTAAQDWGDIANEVAYRDSVIKAMGEGPKKILANEYLMGTKSWLR